MRRVSLLACVSSIVISVAACSSVSTVRVQPENVDVRPGLRPVAAIQANVVSAYLLFIPIPGGVSLDRVVNRMLIVAAKTMGADKVVGLQFHVTPDDGIYTLRRLIGWRSAEASGIAVQVETEAPDPDADQGPEPGATPTPPAPGAPTAP